MQPFRGWTTEGHVLFAGFLLLLAVRAVRVRDRHHRSPLPFRCCYRQLPGLLDRIYQEYMRLHLNAFDASSLRQLQAAIAAVLGRVRTQLSQPWQINEAAHPEPMVRHCVWQGAIARGGMLLRGYDHPRARLYGKLLHCFPLLCKCAVWVVVCAKAPLDTSCCESLQAQRAGCPLRSRFVVAAVGLWNCIQQLPAEHMLRVTVAESLALGGNVGSSWVSDFTAVLNAFGALPDGGMFDDGVPCLPSAHSVLSSFDRWLYGCWSV